MSRSTLLSEIDAVIRDIVPDDDQRRRAIVAIARHFGGAQVYVPPPRPVDPIVREVIVAAHRAGDSPRAIREMTGLTMPAVYNVLREAD